MSTPTSTTTPYCTPAQLIERCDVRTLGDWLSDETPPRRFTSAEVLASTALANILLEASGELESGVLMGERYTVEDLQALQAYDSASQQLLIGIVAGLAFGKVWYRRPRTDDQKFPTMAQWAQGLLEQLSKGARIFGFVEVAEAGRMEHGRITAAEITDRDLLVVQADRYFGRRGDRSDPRRQ